MIKFHADFVDNILDKALLSPRYEDHMKELKKLLSVIHMYTRIEEQHVFNPAA